MPLIETHDYQYRYHGYWEPGGVCRVRIFEGEDRPPVVLVSQLPETRNTSITNLAEYLAAEIVAKHFPERFEEENPFGFIEHYPPTERADGDRGSRYRAVRFASYTPRPVVLGGVERRKLGTPAWTPMTVEAVRQLIGTIEDEPRDVRRIPEQWRP